MCYVAVAGAEARFGRGSEVVFMVESQAVKEAVGALREGGVVLFPTDTVWGVGAVVTRLDGLSRLYAIKGRRLDKPTAVLVSGLAMAAELGKFTRAAAVLAKQHWPGGLTIVVRALKGMVPEIVRGGRNTVGLRAPDHELTLAILNRLGAGIVAGSANYAGAGAPRRFEMIDRRLLDAVDYVIRPSVGGAGASPSEAGKFMPSTVVDTTKEPFKILREGPVELADGQ